MKIEYDVPCPCQEGQVKCAKFQKQYAQVFYMLHSNKNAVVIEADKPRSFISSCCKAFGYGYPKLKYHVIDGNKVQVSKYE